MKRFFYLSLSIAIFCFGGFGSFYLWKSYQFEKEKMSLSLSQKSSPSSQPIVVAAENNLERTEHFAVIGNYYVNEVIRNLEEKGWKIKSVKAMTSPAESSMGCYDVLITYEF